jgi:hypothetical protein
MAENDARLTKILERVARRSQPPRLRLKAVETNDLFVSTRANLVCA